MLTGATRKLYSGFDASTYSSVCLLIIYATDLGTLQLILVLIRLVNAHYVKYVSLSGHLGSSLNYFLRENYFHREAAASKKHFLGHVCMMHSG
eukprot:12673795-Ditylum_brightwellii.AAC.1